MQEELEQRTVLLIENCTKLTAEAFAQAIHAARAGVLSGKGGGGGTEADQRQGSDVVDAAGGGGAGHKG